MNIKAERIEQLIQLINRNLQVIFSGHDDGVVAFDYRPLQKVDAVIFGQDKFAYEMVYFLTSAKEKIDETDFSLFSQWESNFVRGLESLLVECAVISDEIERDCFISRVYCWFTEKLSDRREVPRKSNVTVEDLKKSVGKLTDTGEHTMKALNSFDPNSVVDHRGKLLEEPEDPQAKFGPPDGKTLPPINVRLQAVYPEGMKKIPSYVKHNYPNVLPNRGNNPDSSFLPKIAGGDEKYGMLYNKPETEAEKKMNELWLARRRQEAFDFKTQQQLAIVMDRLALHKARLESDTLRKQETETMLKYAKKPRPSSANDAILGSSSLTGGGNNATITLQSTTGSPTKYRGIAHKLLKDYETPPSSPERKHGSKSPKEQKRADQSAGDVSVINRRSRKDLLTEEGSVSISVTDGERETIIPNSSRMTVLKGGKKLHAPMRFKLDLPEGYAERQQYYMQLSDSDDDDKPDRPAKSLQSMSMTRSGGAAKKKAGGGGNAATKVEVQFKREPPVVRERPASAKQFRSIALNDPEIKVHFRHTNYRRMPLTTEQEQWLQERELARAKKSEEVAKQLFEAYQAKNDKKKDKDKDKGGKDKKGKEGKDTKGRPGTAKSQTGTANVDAANPELKRKYKSAAQFMSVHFPNFENDEDFERMAPMRRMQLLEVAQIMQTTEDYKVSVKEGALKKALVVPQDKPEAICLENLRGAKDGLLFNPNPVEYWRKMVIKKGGGKKGKKKK